MGMVTRFYHNTWWTGDELSALVLGNVIASDGKYEKLEKREDLIAELVVDFKNSEIPKEKIMQPVSEILIETETANMNMIADEHGDDVKNRVRAARQILARIASQYVNATMPLKEGGFDPEDPTPNTKMLPPDSINHASLRTFNYDDLCSKYDDLPDEEFRLECVNEEMEKELYDMYTSVELHLEEHTSTCFKKGPYCRY